MPTAGEPAIVPVLAGILGRDQVLTSLEQRTFFSTDIAGQGAALADAVARIGDVGQLSQVVRACTRAGWTVIPRGGGFSYTGGYTPSGERAVLLDLRPMDSVVEINLVDMYVVVEAGCTWQRLYEALKAKGVRTPYFGPMSGYRATVGGALSQGSFFLGSTQYGTVSDSVLGLEVVLADGSILRTGSWSGADGAPPYLRQYGPDVTGLFLSDTGAMGIKSRAVLKLIPFPAHQAYASFAFGSSAAAVAAVSDVGRSTLAAECYCWDPYFVRLMAVASTGVKEDLHFLSNVVRAGSGLLSGLMAAARIAVAGRRVFEGDTWLVHIVVDDASAQGAAAKLKRLQAMARAGGGKETTATAPMMLRGTPFTDFNVPERRIRTRNLPTNSLSPHSRAGAVTADVYAFLEQNCEEMQRHAIQCGVILFAVGTQAVCVEPLLYWDDDEQFLHNRIDETSDIAGLARFDGRPPATTAAMALREGLKAIFRRHACTHVQIGRAYPWAATRQPEALGLITAIKDIVDPGRLINRGVLDFGAPDL